MRTIVLNTTNITTTDNNVLVYKFPNSVKFEKQSIALASASIYYSWYNISAALGNNKFSFTYPTGAGIITTNYTIPDGLYEISTLNQLLQYQLISLGYYLVNASAQNVYYIEFIVNTAKYGIDINTYPVPTALPAGWTNPGGVSLPGTTAVPTVTLPLGFNKIMGFPVGFTTDTGIITKTATSSIAPQVQPNPSLLFSISNIDNKYSNPTSILYSISPTVAIGTLITERPSNFIWNKLIPGNYSELRLAILGTNLQPIKIQDPAMTIILVIKDDGDF